MAAAIRFFQFNRKLYERVGICPRPNTWFGSYNLRNSMMLLCLSMMLMASTAFLLFQANSMQEYGAAFYVSVSELANIVCIMVTIPKMASIFSLMEKCEEFVEKGQLGK